MAADAAANRCIVHVDMDAFFASVEQRDDASLRGQSVLVGRVHRGVVAAASYEARVFGIHSAMPMSEALRRCPDAKVVSPRMAAYQQASAEIFAIFARYTPAIEALSIDEAFLDVTESLALFGSGETIAARIQADIENELHLVASAGVAPCKFVAKLASDWRKPRGLFVVAQDQLAAVLAPLPVEKLLGIGKKQAQILRSNGFKTFSDIRETSPTRLQSLLGGIGPGLVQLAWGIDTRPVVPEHTAKSIGAEETLDANISEIEPLKPYLLSQALRIASRLAAVPAYASGVQLKLKAADFTLETRRMQLQDGSADPDVLYQAACTLLLRKSLPRKGVRLVGMSAIGLLPGQPPRQLFVPPQAVQRAALEQARLAIEKRFGTSGLTRAGVLNKADRRSDK